MTKRIQRGMRQQTPNMNAAEYEQVKRHNRTQLLTVKIRNEIPGSFGGMRAVQLQERVELAFKYIGM